MPIKASNLQIIELNLDDKKRMKKLSKQETPKEEKKKETIKTKETSKGVKQNASKKTKGA